MHLLWRLALSDALTATLAEVQGWSLPEVMQAHVYLDHIDRRTREAARRRGGTDG